MSVSGCASFAAAAAVSSVADSVYVGAAPTSVACSDAAVIAWSVRSLKLAAAVVSLASLVAIGSLN